MSSIKQQQASSSYPMQQLKTSGNAVALKPSQKPPLSLPYVADTAYSFSAAISSGTIRALPNAKRSQKQIFKRLPLTNKRLPELQSTGSGRQGHEHRIIASHERIMASAPGKQHPLEPVVPQHFLDR